jgi:hypothetical protein
MNLLPFLSFQKHIYLDSFYPLPAFRFGFIKNVYTPSKLSIDFGLFFFSCRLTITINLQKNYKQ